VLLIVLGAITYSIAAPHLQVAHYRHADPVADALQAAHRGDFRLIGIAGRGILVPGADSVLGADAANMCAVRVVPGTGDVITSALTRQLNAVATAYARAYNRTLLAHAPGHRCAPRSAA